jgi:hypothetical protein
MGQWLSRVIVAGWFIGMIGVAVWNGRGAAAQGGESNRLFLSAVQNADLSLHDYMGLVLDCSGSCDYAERANFYTFRGDGSEWGLLAENVSPYGWAWSPNGYYFVYRTGEGDQRQTWLMPLETRQPELLAEGNVFVRWSPNSQYLALITNAQLRIYDVEQRTTTEYPIVENTLYPRSAMWTNDSQSLAWVGSNGGDPLDVFVWGGASTMPRKAFSGWILYGGDLYWSPDGNHLVFNGSTATFQGVYATNRAGVWAQPILDRYVMHGWADGGTRLVLWRESKVYLSQPDGGSIELFFNNRSVSLANISPSPTGEIILMGTSNGLALKRTDAIDYMIVPWCYSYFSEVEWREDEVFACQAPEASTIIFDGKTGTLLHLLPNYANAEFLPESPTLVYLDHYEISYSGGYPHPKYESSSLFNMHAGTFKQIRSPAGEPLGVQEWRYLP